MFKAAPYIILAVFVLGLAYAVWMRFAKPEAYVEIGRTVKEDSHELARLALTWAPAQAGESESPRHSRGLSRCRHETRDASLLAY